MINQQTYIISTYIITTYIISNYYSSSLIQILWKTFWSCVHLLKKTQFNLICLNVAKLTPKKVNVIMLLFPNIVEYSSEMASLPISDFSWFISGN